MKNLVIRIHEFKADPKDYFLLIRYVDIRGKKESSDVDKELMSFIRSFHSITGSKFESERRLETLKAKMLCLFN